MYRENKPIQLSPYDHPDIYPGPRPSNSFMFYKGLAHRIEEDHDTFEDSVIHLSHSDHMYGSFQAPSNEQISVKAFLNEINETPVEERIPVIAYGSNVCLAQLLYKSSLNKNVSDLYLCFRAVMRDSDVIYGAFLAPYGSLPAIIGPVEGAECEVWVTLLTREQVELMNRTEGGYELRAHHGGKVELSLSEQLKTVYAYYYPKALYVEGSLVRFPDIPGKSILPSVWQADMLNKLKELCTYTGTREEFIHQLRWDYIFKQEVLRILRNYTKLVEHEDWTSTRELVSIGKMRLK